MEGKVPNPSDKRLEEAVERVAGKPASTRQMYDDEWLVIDLGKCNSFFRVCNQLHTLPDYRHHRMGHANRGGESISSND